MAPAVRDPGLPLAQLHRLCSPPAFRPSPCLCSKRTARAGPEGPACVPSGNFQTIFSSWPREQPHDQETDGILSGGTISVAQKSGTGAGPPGAAAEAWVSCLRVPAAEPPVCGDRAGETVTGLGRRLYYSLPVCPHIPALSPWEECMVAGRDEGGPSRDGSGAGRAAIRCLRPRR